MSLQLWLTYVVAVFFISGTPGPNMLLAMTHGIHHGFARSTVTMAGLLVGLGIILSISLGGLGAVLLASETAFTVLKYVGAAYLIYLGIKTWRSKEGSLDAGTEAAKVPSRWQRFRTGILISLSNPKAILFGVAFFPQFIDAKRDLAPQIALLLLTFLLIETGWMCIYARSGAQLATWLRRGTRMRWFNRAAGSAFIGVGILLGTFRR